MISRLSVRNYALIDEIEIEFGRGFTVLTGETGAGKSIIIDALSLVLGDRAYSNMIREGFDFAHVEATFINDGDEIVVKREVARDGRNRIFINGERSTVKALREKISNLVDIHGQHEHQRLLNPSSHLEFLDSFAGLKDMVKIYRDKYREFRAVKNRIETIIEDEAERERRKDLLEFQIEEIERADLKDGEDETLEDERTFLRSGEKIAQLAKEVKSLLSEEGGLEDNIGRLNTIMEEMSRLDATVSETSSQSTEALYILKDIEGFINEYIASLDFNPQRLEEVEGRLAQISLLKRKYGGTIEDILTYLSKAKEELYNLETYSETRENLEEKLKTLQDELKRIAFDISKSRKEAAKILEEQVEGELKELGMDGVEFVVSIEYNEGDDAVIDDTGVGFTSSGVDKVSFLISTNPGERPKPMVMVASGGELARVMLALGSILADADETPTLIFDEVDVGLGGRSASQVATRLRRLGGMRQVITISHLPQIAAYSHNHIKVEKKMKGGRAITTVKKI
ncbi:MAG TPA: DNA repair protein RecN, partial [Firmicutes bacterium]|nr:DNA repair protein RecN [Bacillota bacterium]